MSALIDRLRRTVGAVSARPDDAVAVGYADVTAVLSALDAAEAEGARLRAIIADAEREAERVVAHMEAAVRTFESVRDQRDAARAEVAALRAIIEGRAEAPTPDEVRTHAAGARPKTSWCAWLCATSDGTPRIIHLAASGDHIQPLGVEERWLLVAAARWWPLDATGRPCAWPTVTP